MNFKLSINAPWLDLNVPCSQWLWTSAGFVFIKAIKALMVYVRVWARMIVLITQRCVCVCVSMIYELHGLSYKSHSTHILIKTITFQCDVMHCNVFMCNLGFMCSVTHTDITHTPPHLLTLHPAAALTVGCKDLRPLQEIKEMLERIRHLLKP